MPIRYIKMESCYINLFQKINLNQIILFCQSFHCLLVNLSEHFCRRSHFSCRISLVMNTTHLICSRIGAVTFLFFNVLIVIHFGDAVLSEVRKDQFFLTGSNAFQLPNMTFRLVFNFQN